MAHAADGRQHVERRRAERRIGIDVDFARVEADFLRRKQRNPRIGREPQRQAVRRAEHRAAVRRGLEGLVAVDAGGHDQRLRAPEPARCNDRHTALDALHPGEGNLRHGRVLLPRDASQTQQQHRGRRRGQPATPPRGRRHGRRHSARDGRAPLGGGRLERTLLRRRIRKRIAFRTTNQPREIVVLWIVHRLLPTQLQVSVSGSHPRAAIAVRNAVRALASIDCAASKLEPSRAAI